MEYLIGIYILGVVFTSLFIAYRLYEEKSLRIPDLTGWQTLYTSVATCIVWPAFVIYLIHRWLK